MSSLVVIIETNRLDYHEDVVKAAHGDKAASGPASSKRVTTKPDPRVITEHRSVHVHEVRTGCDNLT